MKKFFSLVLALVMALSLTTVAWGATSVSDAAGLLDAVKADGTIELTANITTPLDIGKSDGTVARNIVIDLKGNTLTLGPAIGSTGTETSGMRVLANSTVQIKNGTIAFSELKNAQDKHVLVGIANYGTLTLTDVEVKAGSTVMYTINNRGALTLDGTTSVANGGAGDKIAVTNDPYNYIYTNTDASLTIASGNVSVGTVQVELYGNAQNDGDVVLNISAGHVEKIVDDGASAVDVVGNITGGTFEVAPTAYLAPTAGFVTNPDGSVSVGAKATTGTYDLYSCNNTAVAAATGLSYTKVAAAPKTDGTGTIAYVAVDNGKNYMEISSFEATKADFYVTVSGSKTAVMYLREVSTVSYVASAKEFTNFGYGCGQYTKAYGDTSKYYQVLDGAYKNRVFRAETTGLGFLVDGKIVQLATEVTLNAHTWSATAVDTVTGVPTKAICGKCSTTGTVYASAAKVPAAAVIDVTALSYNGVSYPVVAGYKTVAGPVTGTTDKVQSAETFDAGIAMYVGMSVMAAAGSAVVIGKKKD